MCVQASLSAPAWLNRRRRSGWGGTQGQRGRRKWEVGFMLWCNFMEIVMCGDAASHRRAEQHGLLPAAEKTTRGRTAGTSVSEWGKKKYSAATLYTKQHFLILNINKPPHPHWCTSCWSLRISSECVKQLNTWDEWNHCLFCNLKHTYRVYMSCKRNGGIMIEKKLQHHVYLTVALQPFGENKHISPSSGYMVQLLVLESSTSIAVEI